MPAASPPPPLRVTAIAVSAQLGGTERVLLDLATHASALSIDLHALVPTDGPLVERLRELGIPTDVAPAPRGLLMASQQRGLLWKAAPAIRGVLAWSRALEHHPYLRPGGLAYTIGFKAHLAMAMTHTHPVVWHLHEFPPDSTGRMWRALARWRPDMLIANSEAVAAAWAQPPARPTAAWRIGRPAVVLNGVDLERFRPITPTKWIHDELGIPHDRRLIGMPAVLARWKGHMEIIDAFSHIKDDFPDTDLVFVGGGIYDTLADRRYSGELKKAVAQAAASCAEEAADHPAASSPTGQRVHLLPFQDRVERVYPEFDVTVHYSLRAEPFGRVILESMASGVPVIAADEGGPRELLGDDQEEIGWLVKPRDSEALATALRAALQHSRRTLKAMGARARQRAEAHFSSRRFAEQVSLALHGVVTKSVVTPS